MEIENALARLREVTGAMNRAADSVLVRATLEKTWLLQDRLAFPNQVSHRLPFPSSIKRSKLIKCVFEAVRCSSEEPNSLSWPHPTLWNFTRLLADERLGEGKLHGVPSLPQLALFCCGRKVRSDLHASGLSSHK